MREKPNCEDLQKHLKEGRRDCGKKDLRMKKMKKRGSGKKRSCKISQGSKTNKHTIIKILNRIRG